MITTVLYAWSSKLRLAIQRWIISLQVFMNAFSIGKLSGSRQGPVRDGLPLVGPRPLRLTSKN